MRKTKIICTMGPSSSRPQTVESLILNGMDIARINTSHSTEEDAIHRINLIRKLSQKTGRNTAIMLDLQGPKIRIGVLEKEINLHDNQEIIFTVNENQDLYKKPPVIKVDYEYFLKDIKNGCRIFIDDGLIECQINKINKTAGTAQALVIKGGILKSKKGINLPGISVSVNSVTEKDLRFLDFGIKAGVDFIAQSFVRNHKDVKIIKDRLQVSKSGILVVSKIEKYEAVFNFDSILKQSDAIMVARGDLGIELPEEDVPNIQKEIIKKANIVGKPVITATQMLDSMIRNPRPTRAEVSDVANAIHDGSDALMLSGETASGHYPLESLQMMVRIINKTEENLDYKDILQKKFLVKQNTITESISFAACEIANVLGAKAIITSTQSGSTARQVSKNRPQSIIIGASPNEQVIRQLMLSWGVIPAKTEFKQDIDQVIAEAVKVSKKLKLVSSGDRVIITGGIMVSKPGSTNFINIKDIE